MTKHTDRCPKSKNAPENVTDIERRVTVNNITRRTVKQRVIKNALIHQGKSGAHARKQSKH